MRTRILKKAFDLIDEKVVGTLKNLKDTGWYICRISNGTEKETGCVNYCIALTKGNFKRPGTRQASNYPVDGSIG